MRLMILFLLLSGLVAADPTPQSTAQRLYDWVKQADLRIPQRLGEAKDLMTPELYSQLSRAYAKDPNAGEFLDFDPFSFSQQGSDGYVLGPARLTGGLAKVPVEVIIPGGGKSRYTCILTEQAGDWRVANLVYDAKLDLLQLLRDINK